MNNILTNDSSAATNAANVKSAFDMYASGYFSNITIDTTTSNSHVYMNFYIDSSSESPDMQLDISTSATLGSGTLVKLSVGEDTYSISNTVSGSGTTRIYRTIVTDNGIVLQTSMETGTSTTNVVICKSEDNHILVVFHGSSTIASIGANYTSQNGSISVCDVTSHTSYTYAHNISKNTDNQVLGIPFVSMYSGASQNVYLPITRCFTGTNEAFKYQINGENYVGIGYNTIIVKSE